MTKTQHLQRLADALNDVTEGSYGRPTVYDAATDHAGIGTEILAWDGPFEWTMITARASVFAGETGRFSTSLEPRIAEVLDEIEADGYFLEPVNQTWLVRELTLTTPVATQNHEQNPHRLRRCGDRRISTPQARVTSLQTRTPHGETR